MKNTEDYTVEDAMSTFLRLASEARELRLEVEQMAFRLEAMWARTDEDLTM